MSATSIRLSILVFALCAPAAAAASWPAPRGDHGRQARAPGVAAIDLPAVAWTAFLGGSVSDAQLLPSAVSPGGQPALVLVAAGDVETRVADDTLLWRTDGLDIAMLLGTFDLDGDGGGEIVAVGRGPDGTAGAFVIDAVSGTILWRTPPGIVGVVHDSVRVADFTGDGLPDLFIVNSNGTDPGATPGKGHVFEFTAGASAGAEVAALFTGGRDYYGDFYDAVGDFDGDGALDIFVQGRATVYVYSGQDGSLKASSGPVGNTAAARSPVIVEDVDGDGRDEVFLFARGGWSASFNAVRVAAFAWDPDHPDGPKPVLVWERSAAEPQSDGIDFSYRSVSDVDGDGAFEVVVSFREGPDATWTTEVRDAVDGSLELSIPDERMEDVVDLDVDGVPEILTLGAGGLTAWKVEAGAATTAWTLGERFVAPCLQRPPHWKVSAQRAACRFDVGSPATPAFLLSERDAENQVVALHAVTFQGGAATELGALTTPSGTALTAWNVQTHPDLGPLLSVVSSAGRLTVFDSDLQALNYDPGAQVPVVGVRVRSYDPGYGDLAPFPVAGELDGAPGDEILAVTSDRRALALRFDPEAASPELLWEAEKTTRVAIARKADGSPVPVVVGNTSVAGLDPSTGGTVWTREAYSPDLGSPYGDVIAVDVVGDVAQEVIYQTRGSGGEQRLFILDPTDGSPIVAEIIDVNSSGMRRLAAGRLDGPDSKAVLVGGRLTELWRLDGATGASTPLSNATLGAFEVVVDTDGDDTDEVVNVGRDVLQLPGQWNTPTGTSQPILGAVADCTDGPVYVSGVAFSPDLTARDLTTGDTDWVGTLAGGQVYATPADAEAAGETLGYLMNTAVVDDMGAGVPVAVVGSSDGWLYAVRACDGELVWALDVDAPLRETIVTDYDGDGLLELVVTAANGTLYGIDQKLPGAPVEVLDTDPPAGLPTVDVDEIETWDTLYPAWPAVADATSYLVEVRRDDGTTVTPNPVPVTQTAAPIGGLPLELGATYVVAVRSVAPFGTSAETVSDGVTIVDESPPVLELIGDRSTVELGGEPLNLSWNVTDRTRVETVQLGIEDASGATVAELVDLQDVGTTAIAGGSKFFAEAPVEPGAYTARLVATDIGGHSAERPYQFTVSGGDAPDPGPDEAPEVVDGPGPDAGDAGQVDAGVGVDTGVAGRDRDGCECRGGETGRVPWVLGALLLGWLLRRRRSAGRVA